MWRLLLTGGYTMIPLFISSVLALAVVIEKAVVLRAKRVIPPLLVKAIREINNTEEIHELCGQYPGAFSNIVKTVLTNRAQTKSMIEEQAEFEGRIETNKMERGLVVLEVVAAVAPLLGLLGTVLGLFDIFQVIAKLGVGQTALFSAGIAKALITTVCGLVIAIPSFVAHSYFSKKVNNMVLIMEKEISGLVNRIYPARDRLPLGNRG